MNRRISSFILIFTLCCFCATMIALFYAGSPDAFNIYTAEQVRPDGARLDIVLPAENDEKGHIELACYLYELANERYKNEEKVAVMVNFVSETMSIPVQGVKYYIKNADELLQLEYSYVASSPMVEMLLKAVAPESSIYAERKYTNKNMDKMYKQKTLHSSISVDDDGMPVYSADWDKLIRDEYEDKPVYYAAQDGIYEQTGHKIIPETVSSARVTYNEEKGFYLIEMTLDCENPLTTEVLTAELIENSGAANARYYEIKETIEIWDNGYYKYFASYDKWSGKNVITLDSLLDFRYSFYYGAEACDLSRYQYAEEFKAICLAKQ